MSLGISSPIAGLHLVKDGNNVTGNKDRASHVSKQQFRSLQDSGTLDRCARNNDKGLLDDKRSDTIHTSSKYKRKLRLRLSSIPKAYSRHKRKKTDSTESMGTGCSLRSHKISSGDVSSPSNPQKRTKVAFSVDNVPRFHSPVASSLASTPGKENRLPGYDELLRSSDFPRKPTIKSEANSTAPLVKQLPNSASVVDRLAAETHHQLPRTRSWDDASLKHSRGHADLLSVKETFVNPQRDATAVSEQRSPFKRSMSQADSKPRRSRKPTKETNVSYFSDNQVNQYTILEEIGRGSFGAVHRCLSTKDNIHYAIKIMSKKRLIRKSGLQARHPRNRKISNPLDPLHGEIAILKKVDHPSIVRLVEVIDDPQVDNVYLVFNLMEHGPVINLPADSGLHEDVARSYFRDTLLGIEYLHHSKIIHRDIKPSNILLAEESTVKIADFGVSNMFDDNDDETKFDGSPAFRAPETINEQRDKYSGKAADIWALGVTLYAMIFGKCPFFSTDLMLLFHRIKSAPVSFLVNGLYVDPQLQDLISRMLSKNPDTRITMAEIKVHPWVTVGGCNPLPSTEENCRVIEVTDDDVQHSVTLVSRLTSLVTVKSMLQKRTFRRSKSKQSTS